MGFLFLNFPPAKIILGDVGAAFIGFVFAVLAIIATRFDESRTSFFVIPMLMYVMSRPAMTEEIAVDGPYALVLAPTRELAQQIQATADDLAAHMSVFPTPLDRAPCVLPVITHHES